MTNCQRCGGRLLWDREDARDPLVLKCAACARYAAPPRPHEEPAKRSYLSADYVPGMAHTLRELGR